MNIENHELIEFIDSLNSMVISSFDGQTTHLSYAPCLRDGKCFYACISKLAKHFLNLTNYPDRISIFFLEDENKASSVFARKRANYSCSCEQILDNRDDVFDKFITKFKHDETPKILKELNDFCIFKFTAKNGRFVKGFGHAYEINGLEIVKAVKSL